MCVDLLISMEILIDYHFVACTSTPCHDCQQEKYKLDRTMQSGHSSTQAV